MTDNRYKYYEGATQGRPVPPQPAYRQPVQPSAPPKKPNIFQRPGFSRFVLSLLAYGAVFFFESLAIIPILVFNISDSSLMYSILFEYAGVVAAVAAFVLLGGLAWLMPSIRDVLFTFRFGWWCMALSVLFMGYDIYSYTLEGLSIAPGAFMRVIELAVLCLGIGILEECLFRGIVFNGLLALIGDTHRGVVWSVMITSVIFGLAHVSVSDDFASPLMAVQAVLKITQTGMYSILLCVIVLRTRKLGGVSLFHGLDDFLIMLPGIVLYNESVDTEYVTTGDDAIPTIIFYLIVIALYLPFTIKALLALRRDKDVYQGVFMERVLAERPPVSAPAPVPAPAGYVSGYARQTSGAGPVRPSGHIAGQACPYPQAPVQQVRPRVVPQSSYPPPVAPQGRPIQPSVSWQPVPPAASQMPAAPQQAPTASPGASDWSAPSMSGPVPPSFGEQKTRGYSSGARPSRTWYRDANGNWRE